MASAEIPNRSLFKAPEVCEIAQLQLYVLRSWEAEFPDLGVTRAGTPGRVYRRHDLERVLRLKHMLFVEGLTLAGARRRIEEESAPLPSLDETESAAASASAALAWRGTDAALRRQLTAVQHGLRSLLALLDKGATGQERQPAFQLQPEPSARPRAAKKSSPSGRAAKSSPPRRRAR